MEVAARSGCLVESADRKMKESVWDYSRIALFIIFLWISSSCTPNIVSQPASPPTSQPTEVVYHADLTAVISSLRITRGNEPEIVIPENGTFELQVDDQIETDEQGLGVLTFPNLLEVELFRNAKIHIVEVFKDPTGTTVVRLKQLQGHSRFLLINGANVRLALETEITIVESLEHGTEIILCHAPEKVTCIAVLNGGIKVTGQGTEEVVKGGEATYVRNGLPPIPAVCAPEGIFVTWEDMIRTSGDAPTVTQIVDGLPQLPCMVKIEAGEYVVGVPGGDTFHSALQNVHLDDFWIDIYEVTNYKYQKYVNLTGEQAPTVFPGKPDHPVRGVTWDQANAYCIWAQKRLPKEVEWEAAGRGPGKEPRFFPWGNSTSAEGQILEMPLLETYRVGAFPFNVSPFGVYDLVGNVWEWVGEPYDNSPEEGYKILRGGRFGLIRNLVHREKVIPDDERFVINAGFRCAADQPVE